MAISESEVLPDEVSGVRVGNSTEEWSQNKRVWTTAVSSCAEWLKRQTEGEDPILG